MTRVAIRRAVAGLSAGRDSARDHVIRAIATLMSTLQNRGTISGEDRRDVRAAVHRLWLALREIDRCTAHVTRDGSSARSA